MTQLLWANNAQSNLAGGITSSATTATLTSGTGALFPAPAANQAFKGTFTDAATGLVNEIVLATNVTADTVTIVRAQEGTTNVAWLAGDFFSNLVTAGTMDTFSQVTRLSANMTLYISPTGSDATGNGTLASPWKTLPYAWNWAANNINVGAYTLTFKVAHGTYTAGLSYPGALPIAGSNVTNVIIDGDSSSPSSVIFLTTAADTFRVGAGINCTIQNLTIESTTPGNGVIAVLGGQVFLGAGLIFGACGVAHVAATIGGAVSYTGAYTINGDAVAHMQSYDSGTIYCNSVIAVTITGTPTFSGAFIEPFNAGIVDLKTVPTYTGSITGTAYSVTLNSVLNTYGGSAGLPGSAGSYATGGQVA